MKTKRVVASLIAAGTVAGSVAAGVLLLDSGASATATPGPFSGAAVTQTGVQSPVTLDAAQGETFTPQPLTALVSSAMTPQSAYSQWATGAQVGGLPADATVTTGTLTFPTGKGQYRAKDEPVFAYSWHQCQPAGLGVPVPIAGATPAPLPSPRCTEWMFLDASTGEMIDDTWTQ